MAGQKGLYPNFFISRIEIFEQVVKTSTFLLCHIAVWNCCFGLQPKKLSAARAILTKPLLPLLLCAAPLLFAATLLLYCWPAALWAASATCVVCCGWWLVISFKKGVFRSSVLSCPWCGMSPATTGCTCLLKTLVDSTVQQNLCRLPEAL